MNPWLDQLIWEARNGDDAAARELAGYLAECLKKGESPPPALGDYFAQALKEISHGDKADAALNVAGAENFNRNCEIAREVWRLNHRAAGRLPLRASTRSEGVYDVVAARYKRSAERVKQIYDGLRWLVEAEALSLEPDDERPEHWPDSPDSPEWQKANRRREVAMHSAFARLVEALRERDSSG